MIHSTILIHLIFLRRYYVVRGFESEITGINAELEHDEDEHEKEHHDAHRQSQSHVEGHDHLHNEEDDHIHDQHHQNEKDAPKDAQNSDKSMFLTLQTGTE